MGWVHELELGPSVTHRFKRVSHPVQSPEHCLVAVRLLTVLSQRTGTGQLAPNLRRISSICIENATIGLFNVLSGANIMKVTKPTGFIEDKFMKLVKLCTTVETQKQRYWVQVSLPVAWFFTLSRVHLNAYL